MKARAIFFVVAILCLNPVLTGAAAAGTAGPPNPAERLTDLGAPRWAAGRSAPTGAPASPDAPAVALGQPGTSFRYVRTFGVTEEAYVPDLQHIYAPGGLFIDGSDNLYFVEERGARALKFNAAGQNLLAIGTAGLQIAGQDTFNVPRNIVADANGNIWVTDSCRAVQFDMNGAYLRQIGGDCGNDQTRFDYPRGLAFDHDGRLYVADENNHRVQVYQFNGATPVYSATIGVTGESGSDNTHLYNPTQVAFDSSGRLYILDRSNYRIQRCVYAGSWTCGTFFGETGVAGADLTHLGYAYGLTIDRNDNLFIADTLNQRMLKCNLAGVCNHFAGVTGQLGADNTHFSYPGGVAVDSHGTLYIGDYGNNRIQKFASTGAYAGTLGVTGVPYVPDAVRLNQPNRVAVGSDGSIYVTEDFGERLVKLDANGVQQWTIGTAGVYGADNAHLGHLWSGPTGVALDTAGNVYVADTYNHRIQVFDSNGGWIGRLGKTLESGSDNSHFSGPRGVAVDSAGNIYVADSDNGRIQKCVRNGTGGTCATFAGGFNGPFGVAVDGHGNVFVSEMWGPRGPTVQKCSPAGTCVLFAGVMNEWNDDFGHLSGPSDLTVDAQGRVYVADTWNSRVQIFDATGAYLATIGGSWGSRTGDLRDPSGVAVDRQGNVYIADLTNHRIQKFAPGVPGWRQVNINGFGERNNWGVLALEVFKGDLYAGTRNPVIGATIWRTTNGTIWNRVSEPGFSNAFGSTNSMVWDFATFGDQLYATAASDGNGRGQLWRTEDGSTWSQIVDVGFGDSDDTGVRALAAWGDMFYACTYNPVSGAEIWRSSTGDSGTWSRVVSGGNGNSANYICTGFQEFNGYLYTALENESTGAQVWRTADGSMWSPVVVDGFGDANNYQTGGLAVLAGYLYVGTCNYATPAQLWHSQDGTHWEPVFKNGLGDTNNAKVEGLAVFQGHLYAFLVNEVSGVEAWRSSDGVTWNQINPDGFGDSTNYYTLWSNGLAVYQERLHVGTLNWGNGGLGKIWQLQSQTYLPLVLRQ